MKHLIIAFFICALLSSASAQVLEGGLKGGLSSSKLSTDVAGYTPETVNNYQFGAFARINMGRFYIQPEAYYNTRSGEFTDKSFPGVVNSFDMKTVDVPALLGLKLIKQESFNLRVMAGPELSFLTDKEAKGQFETDHLKNSVWGWQYGAGVDILFLSFDVRKISYGKNFAPDFDTKTGTFVLSLGIKLF